jgi:hypothetical protein
LRFIEAGDLPPGEQRKALGKRLSDYRYLMGRIQHRVKELQQWKDEPSLEEANAMLDAAQHVLDLDETTEKDRKRRVGQLTWLTATKNARRKKLPAGSES